MSNLSVQRRLTYGCCQIGKLSKRFLSQRSIPPSKTSYRWCWCHLSNWEVGWSQEAPRYPMVSYSNKQTMGKETKASSNSKAWSLRPSPLGHPFGLSSKERFPFSSLPLPIRPAALLRATDPRLPVKPMALTCLEETYGIKGLGLGLTSNNYSKYTYMLSVHNLASHTWSCSPCRKTFEANRHWHLRGGTPTTLYVYTVITVDWKNPALKVSEIYLNMR